MTLKDKIAILGLTALTSCTTLPREEYHVKDLNVVFDSYDNVNKAYQEITYGLRPHDKVAGFQFGNTIMVKHGDFYTLGHELNHVLKGEFHE